MGRYVLGFGEIDGTQTSGVGGKGAHLGELSRMEGVRVPPGFCVTTAHQLVKRSQGPVDVAIVVGATVGTGAIASHVPPVACAMEARTGRRALTHSDATLELVT